MENGWHIWQGLMCIIIISCQGPFHFHWLFRGSILCEESMPITPSLKNIPLFMHKKIDTSNRILTNMNVIRWKQHQMSRMLILRFVTRCMLYSRRAITMISSERNPRRKKGSLKRDLWKIRWHIRQGFMCIIIISCQAPFHIHKPLPF